jgi:uncharacterized membrane protein YqjE
MAKDREEAGTALARSDVRPEVGQELRREVRADARPDLDPSALTSTKLVGETAREAIALIKAQVDLARVELKEDLRAEVAAAKGISVGAVCGLSGLTLLLAAVAVALAAVMPAWGAFLLVAGVVLVVGAIFAAVGVKKIRVPLQRTRKSLEEDVRWVKERAAET